MEGMYDDIRAQGTREECAGEEEGEVDVAEVLSTSGISGVDGKG